MSLPKGIFCLRYLYISSFLEIFRMGKIYTRTGDKGRTSLYTDQKILKNDALIDAVGAVDECNSSIGVALSFFPPEDAFDLLREQLVTIQHALFDLGAALATPRTTAPSSKIEKTRFDHEAVEWLEKWIDAMDDKLPRLKTFILPGGDQAAAFIHLSRSICRRAERAVITLYVRGDASEHVLAYLNRLSDYFFMLSRYINFITHTKEVVWEPHHHPQKK